MRYLLLVLLLLITGSWGCGKEDEDDPLIIKIMPDKTPYVVGLLEASPDTTHHHTQIFVGYLTDPLDRYYKPGADPLSVGFKNIWSPTLWAQVYKKVGFFHLQIRKEQDATVKLIGPLEENSKEIILHHEGDGVYGDINRQLDIQAEKTYRLVVDYPDGRKYRAETTVPGMPQWINPVPKETPIKMKLWYNPADKKWGEVNQEPLSFPFKLGRDNIYTIHKINLSSDRTAWELESNQQLPWEAKGNYLRDGGGYWIMTNSQYLNNPAKIYQNFLWGYPSVMPPYKSEKIWIRLSEFGKDLAPDYYEFEYTDVLGHIGDNMGIQEDRWSSWSKRDTTYWFRISNIKRQNSPSEAVSHQKAAGVFGSYSSRYASTTLIPIRDYNLCDYGWSCKK